MAAIVYCILGNIFLLYSIVRMANKGFNIIIGDVGRTGGWDTKDKESLNCFGSTDRQWKKTVHNFCLDESKNKGDE